MDEVAEEVIEEVGVESYSHKCVVPRGKYMNAKLKTVLEKLKKIAHSCHESGQIGGVYHEGEQVLLYVDESGDDIYIRPDEAGTGVSPFQFGRIGGRVMISRVPLITKREPYDIVVVACLITLRKEYPTFHISSDGTTEDWEDGLMLYNALNDKKIKIETIHTWLNE
jgi:hypothetical protein